MLAKRVAQMALGLAVGGGALLTAIAAGAGPLPEAGIGLPRDVSAEGHRIDWLIKVTGGFTAILFVIMCVWMALAVLKHNKDHKAEYDHGDAKHQVKFAATLSAIIFFVVDGNLWVNSTIDVNNVFWNFEMVENDPTTVRIELNAHQWTWDFRYAGADKKFTTPDDIIKMNELRVPVDTPIMMNIASTDVIHSFYLPNLRIKQDAMPGMMNKMWFKAAQTGEFDIGCAQHCGTNHYKMKGTLVVMSKEEYAKWEREASAIASRAYDPDDTNSHWGWEWQTK
jgi:cytochrome c oxidase subunit II